MSQDVLRRNNVKGSGRGTRSMLFAHGFGCDQNMWRFIAPSKVGEYLSRHLPHSTLRQLEATGHCPHMSHPEETVRGIKEHLGDAEDE